jgi:hypothetical protein
MNLNHIAVFSTIKENIYGLVCKVKGHTLKKAGSCPFTGMTYDYCSRCNKMIPTEEID